MIDIIRWCWWICGRRTLCGFLAVLLTLWLGHSVIACTRFCQSYPIHLLSQSVISVFLTLCRTLCAVRRERKSLCSLFHLQIVSERLLAVWLVTNVQIITGFAEKLAPVFSSRTGPLSLSTWHFAGNLCLSSGFEVMSFCILQ